jgi:RNA polymerase primary sigma factor
LSQELGRDPLAEEIALEMNVDVDKIYQIEKIDQDTVSLESPVGATTTTASRCFGDFIKDDKILSPDQEVARRILADQLKEILDELHLKSARFLKLRHGLEDGIYHTLEEVGKKFGVTRERIRQIEAKRLSASAATKKQSACAATNLLPFQTILYCQGAPRRSRRRWCRRHPSLFWDG